MKLELVAAGLQFPEGPVAMADGSVLVVEIQRQTLTRVLPDGQLEFIAQVGGGPNGAAIGPDGAVYVCNNGGFNWTIREDGTTAPHGKPADYTGGSIQRVDLATAEVRTLYTECDGNRLRGPNDLVFDAAGGIWFTDVGRLTEDFVYRGAVYYALPDGSHIVKARGGLLTPNGIGLSPDQTELYTAETLTGRLWAFRIAAPGVLESPKAAGARHPGMPGRLLTTTSDYRLFDSLAVEEGGAVCVATLNDGGVTVIDQSGASMPLRIPDDPHVTNICFGGADMQNAWITSSGRGRLYKTRWPRPGLKLTFNA